METKGNGKIPAGLNIPYILNGEFYEIIAQKGEHVTVRCCYCESRNIYKGSIRSTGNFHMHIKRKHPFLLPRVQEVKINSYYHRRPEKIKPESNKIEIKRSTRYEQQLKNEQSAANKLVTNDISNAPGPSKGECIVNTVNSPEDLRTTPREKEQSPAIGNPISKLEESFVRIENAMRGIEKELRQRNQIETNKLFLELAKFKYVHPHFSFNS